MKQENHPTIRLKHKPITLLGFLFITACMFFATAKLNAQGFEGYYRYPTIHNETIVFAAEGDLWSVSLQGGLAQRLTTHHGEEFNPSISPDGKTIAFSATYEGPAEVYTMPITGGLPQRWTYQADASLVNGWTPGGELVYATRFYSTLPDYQLVKIDPATKKETRVPLHQASEASFTSNGKTVFFVRPSYHNNVTKRYKGGTARQIWKYTDGGAEAIKLTTDYTGESHHPMWWNRRVYFISDRDGTMNIWSMNESGKDLQQHTEHEEFDVRYASIHKGHIVYRRGADIWHLDIKAGRNKKVSIRLATDLDQLREKWVDNPQQYITSVNLHPNGDKVVITSRGRVFVAPVNSGRMVQLSRKEGVRYRDAIFSADGKNIITLSDESGEFEFVQVAATGLGEHKALTNNGKTLRFQASASPDGKYLAYRDLDDHWWLLNIEDGQQKKISTKNYGGSSQINWSPDSQWLTYIQAADNDFSQIHIYNVATGDQFPLTSDRANSMDPVWSADGKWIYFLSDRNFRSLVGSPWGTRQPEPYFDKKMKIYQISLQKGERSPFSADNELMEDSENEKGDKKEVVVTIDKEGIQRRLQEVPIPPGNYRTLRGNARTLYFISSGTGLGSSNQLMALPITNKEPKPKEVTKAIRGYSLSADGKKMLIYKGTSIYVINAGTGAANLNNGKVDLSNWAFSMNVREDWRQIFKDAWRMERDYFYDPGMHGVDWDKMYEKYLPMVDRVTTRNELSDLIGRFVGELSALHTSVRGGDLRRGDDQIRVASLGARLMRSEGKGGYVIDYIYQADPDYPNERSPLDHPEMDIAVGDVIEHINGVSTLSVPHIGALLRNQAREQIRIGVKSSQSGTSKDHIVVPASSEFSLRYRDWEYSRRLEVDDKADGKIGYVHLRAMGSNDLSQWYREFYPVFHKQGLIIDVRHNNGGNIESFILEKLMRQAWMYWKVRDKKPYWNMQYAYRGHIVVLVDEKTSSDGEAFADGFQRLGLGKVIGKRTWGGEIWLSSSNRLTDGGLARAPMMGVYGPEGEWLIEGHGLEPDIEVDNLPHETFNGKDAQLEAAIQYLLEEIKKDPREVPKAPEFPDKSFNGNGNK